MENIGKRSGITSALNFRSCGVDKRWMGLLTPACPESDMRAKKKVVFMEVLDSCLKTHFILDLVMTSDLPKVR